ncbi:hypothetical protein DICVIV_07966 [Dictyocaulus viviparus]|uniref:Uncharacterized protein n=1 Tax=Dictyocaulus viviparus TaxID=29172 RepID=A0A0D8XN45_DICVI|nr:hypothetical protein DICVIV_07966 [Dictyocaulus viviparus]
MRSLLRTVQIRTDGNIYPFLKTIRYRDLPTPMDKGVPLWFTLFFVMDKGVPLWFTLFFCGLAMLVIVLCLVGWMCSMIKSSNRDTLKEMSIISLISKGYRHGNVIQSEKETLSELESATMTICTSDTRILASE